MERPWQRYESVAIYLLNQFASHLGLDRVEGKQLVAGTSGTSWEIDGRGVRTGDTEAIVVVECRRYTASKQNQEKLAGLAFRITDVGADGGLLVSPLGFQEGAAKVAAAAGVVDVRLNPDCTNTDYVLQFLNRVFVGLSDSVRLTDTVHVVVIPAEPN